MPDLKEAEELAAFYFQYAAWMSVNLVYPPLQVVGADHQV